MSSYGSESGSEVDITFYAKETRNGKPVKSFSETHKIKNGKLIYSEIKEIEMKCKPTRNMSSLRESSRKTSRSRINPTGSRYTKKSPHFKDQVTDKAVQRSPEQKHFNRNIYQHTSPYNFESSRSRKYRKYQTMTSPSWTERNYQNRSSPLKNRSDSSHSRCCKSPVFRRNIDSDRTPDCPSSHFKDRQVSKSPNMKSPPKSNLKKYSPRTEHKTSPTPTQTKSPNRHRAIEIVHSPTTSSDDSSICQMQSGHNSKIRDLIKLHEEFNRQAEVEGQNNNRYAKIGKNYNRRLKDSQNYNRPAKVENQNEFNYHDSNALEDKGFSRRRRTEVRHSNVSERHTEVECQKEKKVSHSNVLADHRISRRRTSEVHRSNDLADCGILRRQRSKVHHSNIVAKHEISRRRLRSELRHPNATDLPFPNHMYNVHDHFGGDSEESVDENYELESLSVRMARTKIEAPPLYSKRDMIGPVISSADYDWGQGDHISRSSSSTSVCVTFHTCCDDERCIEDSDSATSVENASSDRKGRFKVYQRGSGSSNKLHRNLPKKNSENNVHYRQNRRQLADSPSRCSCKCHSVDIETDIQTTTDDEDDVTKRVIKQMVHKKSIQDSSTKYSKGHSDSKKSPMKKDTGRTRFNEFYKKFSNNSRIGRSPKADIVGKFDARQKTKRKLSNDGYSK
ncbi:hypothetical protein JTE90_026159 [Oedothorax gibbosus]|uniref:Uncharacterized protein n=1 Tax=Oedothorax gibbosus TaxID=931172 RepID=A0AAV6UGL6_9ARAC|nr:hypothetical protein JTE90_026159 [Oedothorax gibbosus]